MQNQPSQLYPFGPLPPCPSSSPSPSLAESRSSSTNHMSSLPKTVLDVFVLPGNNAIENVTDDVVGELNQLNENTEGDTSENDEVHSFSALKSFVYFNEN